MKLNQPYILQAKGSVNIQVYTLDDSEIAYDDHNDILANAKNIISRCIGGSIGYAIDSIQAFRDGNLLISKSAEITFPSINKVAFFVEFEALDFNGLVDEVRLTSTTGGDFSHVVGLTIEKDSTKNMSITWSIEII